MSLPARDTRRILGSDSLMWRHFGETRQHPEKLLAQEVSQQASAA